MECGGVRAWPCVNTQCTVPLFLQKDAQMQPEGGSLAHEFGIHRSSVGVCAQTKLHKMCKEGPLLLQCSEATETES